MAGTGVSPGGARAAHGVSGPRPRSCSGQRVALFRRCFVVARSSVCRDPSASCVCWQPASPASPTIGRRGQVGGLAFHCKRLHQPPGKTGGALGQAALSPLRMKGEQPLFPKMAFGFVPEPVRTEAALCAGFGATSRLQGLESPAHPTPPHLISLFASSWFQLLVPHGPVQPWVTNPHPAPKSCSLCPGPRLTPVPSPGGLAWSLALLEALEGHADLGSADLSRAEVITKEAHRDGRRGESLSPEGPRAAVHVEGGTCGRMARGRGQMVHSGTLWEERPLCWLFCPEDSWGQGPLSASTLGPGLDAPRGQPARLLSWPADGALCGSSINTCSG